MDNSAPRKRYTRKQIKKLADARCHFCGEDDYAVLDAHRIIPGVEGGTYNTMNMVTCCASCHRKCHSGSIKVDRKYLCTNGQWVLHYWEDGEEFWH